MKKTSNLLKLLGLAFLLPAPLFAQAAEPYSWQTPQSKLLPNGDMEWAPRPYHFETGEIIRYIDYQNGDDNNSGESKNSPWKHHPWDRDAGGKAAEASGAITYVFKGGSIYRGQLNADESGEPGNPIRLTVDPSWGEGRAWFFGSEKLPANWVPAASVDHPDRIPAPEKVWAIDLKEAGFELKNDYVVGTAPGESDHGGPNTHRFKADELGLYWVKAPDDYRMQTLASSPDWKPMGEDFAMDYWNVVDSSGERDGVGGFKDSIWAGKNLPEDYFDGGIIWMAWRGLMGTPTPQNIENPVVLNNGRQAPYFDPEQGLLLTRKWGGMGKGGLPYLIENLPQFLDGEGEFYLDYGSGLLFLIPPRGLDPNQMHLEFTTRRGTILIDDRSHIEIAGPGFAFAFGETIEALYGVKNLRIRHCVFRNLGDTGVEIMQERHADSLKVMDQISIEDCLFEDIAGTAINIKGTRIWNPIEYRGRLEEAKILRNKIYNIGFRHRGPHYSNVPAINLEFPRRAEVAGNIVERVMGSGIVVHGGKGGSIGRADALAEDVPLIRILIHHNKTEDTALGVNDYGGMALWQGGPTYAYNNLIGNSPGHAPAGIFGIHRPVNLSYPLYLDGAFKQYCFNNIIWGRTTDESDPFANTTPGYWMVFGFLNQYFHNTVYRQNQGMGGSSGNRNDIVGNIFADIDDLFIKSNRIGDPSLVGGGDDTASSGLRGISSLAFAHNVFHGKAKAGYLIRDREMEKAGLEKKIQADSIAKLEEQMQDFPLRYAELGVKAEQSPVKGAPEAPIGVLTEEVSFVPVDGSPAINFSGTYFVPWSLYGTVGEWHFGENHADPATVVDYHWYMSEAHYERSMYEQVPTYDFVMDEATLEDYVDGPTEDWRRSALVLDGTQFGVSKDAAMRSDLVINLGLLEAASNRDVPEAPAPWEMDPPSGPKGEYSMDDFMTYPGKFRKSPIISTQNLLIDCYIRTEPGGSGSIVSKHDGANGYVMRIDGEGKAEFGISSNNRHAKISSEVAVNDGNWHYLLAEVNRETGEMNIYVDGELSNTGKCDLPQSASIDTQADLYLGRLAVDSGYFTGAIDFLRICQGTLEDAHTDMAELYEWQTNGPFRYDYFGKAPVGKRDAGAIEHVR